MKSEAYKNMQVLLNDVFGYAKRYGNPRRELEINIGYYSFSRLPERNQVRSVQYQLPFEEGEVVLSVRNVYLERSDGSSWLDAWEKSVEHSIAFIWQGQEVFRANRDHSREMYRSGARNTYESPESPWFFNWSLDQEIAADMMEHLIGNYDLASKVSLG